MFFDKKISVVMATFNGEKHIREQLDSILAQTVKPDEIIISDDGSTDRTIEIIESIANTNEGVDIDWVILNDNPRHGYTGNFEHALLFSSGDYTFLCDQDDVWEKNKVCRVVQEFLNHPDAWLICHDAIMVDANLHEINAPFTPNFPRDQLTVSNDSLFRFGREEFLAKSVTETFPGMVMCLSRECVKNILPIPKMNGHDTWTFFCAICEEKAYFLPEMLVCYRIHGTNESSPVESRRNFMHRIKKYRKMVLTPISYSKPLYEQSSAMLKRLKEYGFDEREEAYQKAKAIFFMSCELRKAETSGRFKGILLLLKLHHSDSYYHLVGVRQFVAHLLNIILFSKEYRIGCL